MTKGNIRHLKKIHFSTKFADIETKAKAEYNDDDLGICLANVHISEGNKFSYLQHRSLLIGWFYSYKSLTTLGFLACVSPFYFHMRGFDSSHSHCVFLVLVIKEIDISPSLSSLLASPSPLPSPFDSTVMKKCLFLRFRYHGYLYKIK